MTRPQSKASGTPHTFARGPSRVRRLVDHLIVIGGAGALTLAFFVLLPIIQVMGATKTDTVTLMRVDNAHVPPPPPPPEPEKPKEEEQEPEPPKLADEAPPPDFSQLEMVLGGGSGSGFMGKGFGVDLKDFGGADGFDNDSFNMGDVDQPPRPTYTADPRLNARLMKRTPATVNLLVVVTERGRVSKVLVESSTDPMFEPPAVRAMKKWRFEPGRKNGQAVTWRVKQTIQFPKGR